MGYSCATSCFCPWSTQSTRSSHSSIFLAGASLIPVIGVHPDLASHGNRRSTNRDGGSRPLTDIREGCRRLWTRGKRTTLNSTRLRKRPRRVSKTAISKPVPVTRPSSFVGHLPQQAGSRAFGAGRLNLDKLAKHAQEALSSHPPVHPSDPIVFVNSGLTSSPSRREQQPYSASLISGERQLRRRGRVFEIETQQRLQSMLPNHDAKEGRKIVPNFSLPTPATTPDAALPIVRAQSTTPGS